jgi:uncharacterized protein YlbG (UPF0298 family)
MTQKRGRKLIPENKKKKAVIIYLSDEQVEQLGGRLTASKMLQNYSLTKLKQNAKKEII